MGKEHELDGTCACLTCSLTRMMAVHFRERRMEDLGPSDTMELPTWMLCMLHDYIMSAKILHHNLTKYIMQEGACILVDPRSVKAKVLIDVLERTDDAMTAMVRISNLPAEHTITRDLKMEILKDANKAFVK